VFERRSKEREKWKGNAVNAERKPKTAAHRACRRQGDRTSSSRELGGRGAKGGIERSLEVEPYLKAM